MLSAFWSPASSVNIAAKGAAAVEVHFLPFSLGHRQCSVLFINDKIGEFLYCIEANTLLPLPSPMPFTESPHSIRISSAAAARRGRGFFGGDDRVVYWKCESNESFTEDLSIPLDNAARENALGMSCFIVHLLCRSKNRAPHLLIEYRVWRHHFTNFSIQILRGSLSKVLRLISDEKKNRFRSNFAHRWHLMTK